MKLSFGPGALVAAAFVGPGTVTACTVAGAQFGYALLWALVFATLATIILQDMTARLGAGAKTGLGDALLAAMPGRMGAIAAAALVAIAIIGGAAAYEAGNLTGAALGVEAAWGEGAPRRAVIAAGLGGAAAGLLLHGRYQTLERVLLLVAGAMCMAFLAAAVLLRPDPIGLLRGLVPSAPDGSGLTVLALIGTTVVPYNLFLHAAAARERWPTEEDGAKAARHESRLSIGLGGLVSMAILSAAATALFGTGQSVESAADMARAVEPVFGSAARFLIGLGLAAAGLTSAITAPMAAGYAMAEIAGGEDPKRRQRMFRYVSLAVLGFGVGAALAGVRPISLILAAQLANGLLLPAVALFLMVAMNRRTLLGEHANGLVANLAGGGVTLVAFALGIRTVLRAVGVWP